VGGRRRTSRRWAQPGPTRAREALYCAKGWSGSGTVSSIRFVPSCWKVGLPTPGRYASAYRIAGHPRQVFRRRGTWGAKPATGAGFRSVSEACPPTPRACTCTIFGNLPKSGGEWRRVMAGAHGSPAPTTLGKTTWSALAAGAARDGAVLISRAASTAAGLESLSRQNGPSADPSSVTQLSGGWVGSTTTYPRRCGPALARHHSARRHR
jgi:hypothetical protein